MAASDSDFGERAFVRFVDLPAQGVRTRHEAEQAPASVHDRVGAVLRLGLEEAHGVGEVHLARKRRRIGGHQLRGLQKLERVDGIFAKHVLAAPRDLLGQDRALHDEDADRVGRRAGRDGLGDRRQMIGQLGGEERSGHRRAHDSAHDSRHPDHRPETGVAGEVLADQEARAAAEDQQRREDSAGGARTQSDQPDDRLDHQQQEHRLDHEIAVEQRLDNVVAGAEHPNVEQAADADDDGADRRPPHPVDGQAVEAVLDSVEDEGEDRSEEPGDEAEARGNRHRRDAGGRRRCKREEWPGADQ